MKQIRIIQANLSTPIGSSSLEFIVFNVKSNLKGDLFTS